MIRIRASTVRWDERRHYSATTQGWAYNRLNLSQAKLGLNQPKKSINDPSTTALRPPFPLYLWDPQTYVTYVEASPLHVRTEAAKKTLFVVIPSHLLPPLAAQSPNYYNIPLSLSNLYPAPGYW